MELSARNKLKGKVKSINADNITAEVILEVGGQEMSAVITKSSADQLSLKAGDDVTAAVKATNVMIMK